MRGRRDMANAVLVVDMLIGFLEPGHNLYRGDDARKGIPNIKRLIERERASGSKVFFICDSHAPDDLEFRISPEHCVMGTEEDIIVSELSGYEGDVIPRKRYSGFYGTELAQRLAGMGPDKIIICGVCTDICVMHTAADARNRDYSVEVPVECVATFDPEAHTYALQHMEMILGAKLVREAASAAS